MPKPPRITGLNVDIRLHIYGFLNQNDTKIIHEDKDDYYLYDSPQWNTLTNPRIPVKPYEIEIAFACIVGDLEVLQYVHGFSDTLAVPDEVESDVDNYYPYDASSHLALFYRINALLVCHRNWKTLLWAREMNFPSDEWSLNIAILTGVDERILKWLHRCCGPCLYFDMCLTFEYAAGCCSLDFIKWLRLQGCSWDGSCFTRAIKRGDWEIIIWLRCNGCPPADDPFSYSMSLKCAVIKNDPLFVQYLLREFEGYTLRDTDFLPTALERSDIPVLQLLVDAGYAFKTHEYFANAIDCYDRNLNCLQFLRRTGCPWNEEVFVAAVERGDLEILRWLRQEGCPWDASVFTKALENGDLDIIQWLFEQKCPSDEDSMKVVMEKYVLVAR
jgi:hypothetical protein